VIGDRDQVEHEAVLREVFARFLSHATFRVSTGIGHLFPWKHRMRLPMHAEACWTFSELRKQARVMSEMGHRSRHRQRANLRARRLISSALWFSMAMRRCRRLAFTRKDHADEI
jgi:hypothetical protein